MPSTARPADATCTEVMAEAATAGWRVTGLVTPVASEIREVAVAAIPSDTYTSAARFWVSANHKPSHPASSTPAAVIAASPGRGKVSSPNSGGMAVRSSAGVGLSHATSG